MSTADFTAENHGTVIIFHAMTDRAKDEIEFMNLEDWQFVGNDSFAIDHGIARHFAETLLSFGFSLE